MQAAPSCPAPTHWWWTRVSGPLLHWQLCLGAYSVVFFFFSSWLCCPLRFQNSPQALLCEGFLLCGDFSSFLTPSPGWVSVPKSFVSVFVFYILSYLFLKRSGCLAAWCSPPAFRCLMERLNYLIIWKLIGSSMYVLKYIKRILRNMNF